MDNGSLLNIQSALRIWNINASNLAAVARRSLALIRVEINENRKNFSMRQLVYLQDMMGNFVFIHF